MKEASVDIYPNPLSNSALSFDFHNISAQAQIRIYDFSGRLIYNTKIAVDDSTYRLNIDLSRGTYLCANNQY